MVVDFIAFLSGYIMKLGEFKETHCILKYSTVLVSFLDASSFILPRVTSSLFVLMELFDKFHSRASGKSALALAMQLEFTTCTLWLLLVLFSFQKAISLRRQFVVVGIPRYTYIDSS